MSKWKVKKVGGESGSYSQIRSGRGGGGQKFGERFLPPPLPLDVFCPHPRLKNLSPVFVYLLHSYFFPLLFFKLWGGGFTQKTDAMP